MDPVGSGNEGLLLPSPLVFNSFTEGSCPSSTAPLAKVKTRLLINAIDLNMVAKQVPAVFVTNHWQK